MIALLFSALLGLQAEAGNFRVQSSASQSQSGGEATQIDDIVVHGQRLSAATSEFTRRIAAPAADRGAATWRDQVCIGTANVRQEMADHIISRISAVAEDVGLRTGQLGCEPRVMVVFVEDGKATARDLVRAKGREFRTGVPGSDLGRAALEAFQVSDRPVRWWHASLPVVASTGRSAQRLRGQMPVDLAVRQLTHPAELGTDVVSDTGSSRLRSPIGDNLSQVFIIVEVDQVIGVDLASLSDYLAMIVLAQIDPDVDTGPYDSILSLFAHPDGGPIGLTNWDRAYLQGLYRAEQTAENPRARLAAVADSMARRVRDHRAPQ